MWLDAKYSEKQNTYSRKIEHVQHQIVVWDRHFSKKNYDWDAIFRKFILHMAATMTELVFALDFHILLERSALRRMSSTYQTESGLLYI